MTTTFQIIDRTTGEVIGTASGLNGARRVIRSGEFGSNLGYRRV